MLRHLRGIVCGLGLGVILARGATAQLASDFAVRVVDSANLGGGAYGDPSAVLGKPTTWILEPGNPNPIPCTLVYGAWNAAPDGTKLVTTLGTAQQTGRVVVEFDPPITPDPFHWYGKEFLVFGNAFFSADATITNTTDYLSVHIISPNVNSEPVTISVSPDGVLWYSYPSPVADSYYPTQAFNWSPYLRRLNEEQDWTKPVNPSVTPAQFTNKTVADAILLYDKSAGGTAFSLAESGFASVRYIKAESRGGEVDGFARVGFTKKDLRIHIQLEGLVTNAPLQPLTFTLTPSYGAVITQHTSTNSSGAVLLYDVPLTTYTLRVKGEKWLAKQTTLTPSNGAFPVLTLTLKAGDANNDNTVDLADLLLLIAHYNQTQGSGDYLAAADFDGDGSNDIADLLLLIGNYNEAGD